MTGQWQIGRERIIKISKTVWRKSNRGQKGLELFHFVSGQICRGGLKIGKGLVKLFDSRAISAPMKGLVADDVLHRLSHHRAFHGVKNICETSATIDASDIS